MHNSPTLEFGFCLYKIYHDQSNLGKRFADYSPLSGETKVGTQAETWRLEMKQTPWRDTAYWFTFRLTSTYLSYVLQVLPAPGWHGPQLSGHPTVVSDQLHAP